MPSGSSGVLAALVATLTLIGDGAARRSAARYVVDNFALLFKVFFLSVAIVVLALSLPVLPRGRVLPGGVLLPAADVVPRLRHDAAARATCCCCSSRSSWSRRRGS